MTHEIRNRLQEHDSQASPTPVLDAKNRARQYWLADGFASLVVGVGLFGFSLSNLFENLQHRHTFWSAIVSLIALAIYLLSLLRYREIVEWLKIRVTYPRTGYVQAPPGGENPLLLLETRTPSSSREKMIRRFSSALLLVIGSSFFIFTTSASRWVWPIFGVTYAIPAWLCRKEGLFSPIAISFYLLIAAIFTVFPPPIALHRDVGILTISIGMLLDGAVRLLLYVRRNPIPKAPTA